VPFDRLDGALKADVGRRQKTDGGQQEQAGIEGVGTVRLDEASERGVVSARTDLVVQRPTNGSPTIHGPCSGVPKSAAKQAPESNRGQHSQSIDPRRETSAAVSQSPIRA
jgi:hypothetical protein